MNYIVTGGYSSGKVLSMVLYSRVFPTTKITVPDLHSLDKLVAMGVRPSQIIVASESKKIAGLQSK